MRSAPGAERAAALPFPEVALLAKRGAVALLPVGSTEAHGPHLPLDTDVVIAEGVCDRAAGRLAAKGVPSLVFPALPYGVTEFAKAFAGTVSLPAAAFRELALGVVRGIAAHGFTRIGLVNHHLEPAHFTALHEVVKTLGAEGLKVSLADHRKKPIAPLLGEEFCRGGSHAGFYETSLVLACDASRVQDAVRRGLPKLDINLAQKIREGAQDFAACGGPDAYFGDPASASAGEGERLLGILADATVEALLALP